MTTQDPALLSEYQEYYAIQENLGINVTPLPDDFVLPNDNDFLAAIPEVFRLASELQVVDGQAIAQLKSLGDAGRLISEVLTQQNRKLTALLGYLLRTEDSPEQRKNAFEYGGAGVGFYSEQALDLNSLVEVKLFLTQESAAIYTLAEIISCEPSDEAFRIKALFRRISDEDREVMVRASLHAQSRLLKKRAAARDTSADAE